MVANPIRMGRLQRSDGTVIMVPMDHGISLGPVKGLRDPGKAIAAVAASATCVALHRGLVRHAALHAKELGILMHLSASNDRGPAPNRKELVATVEDAVRAGCDGVSIHINVGSNHEPQMIRDAGAVASACAEWDMPLLAMMYPRGGTIRDPFDARLVAHAARLGGELGADWVKVPFTGDSKSFKRVVEGATVPVIIAGGPKQDSFDGFLDQVRAAKDAGATGVSIGRNVFQHDDPSAAIDAVASIFS